MRLRDLLALIAVCAVWGVNFVVAKFSITGSPGWVPGFEGSPPFFFAFLRFALLFVILSPWLRPRPQDMKAMVGIALSMGALQYALMFLGLQWATPSGMAITLQMGVPFATLLSVVMLKERLGLPRITGIIIAFAGIILVVARPGIGGLSFGLLLGIGAAFSGALGMILVKRMPLDSMRMQAWIGLISWPPLLAMSLVFEHDQTASVMAGGWPFLLTVLFTVLLVNVFGHGVFYKMLQRYDATMIAPITLLAPLIGVVSGIVITGDEAGWRLFVGGGMALVGVGIIALRPNRALPEAGLAREKNL